MQPLRPRNRLSFFRLAPLIAELRRLAVIGFAVIGAAATTSVASSNDRPPFEPRYFHDRILVAELLLKDAIEKRSGDRAAVLYNSLINEILTVQPTTHTPCLHALHTFVPVSLFAMSQLAPKERFADLDRAWTFYREERAKCAHLVDRKEAVQILPERLSEAF